MIRISNVVLPSDEQWEAVIRGMRNPLNSWDKSDSKYTTSRWCGWSYIVGEQDLKLMNRLSKAGTDHSKFLRMIPVTLDITTNHIFWAEFDTYKVGTVRNSCSKMHKIHVKEFDKKDFSCEGINEVGGLAERHLDRTIRILEWLRVEFNRTGEKKYWRAMIELLPLGYNIRATVSLNYEVLKNMYHARKNHKLSEWKKFCHWIECLPFSEELILCNTQ